jgi:hypothetical protein
MPATHVDFKCRAEVKDKQMRAVGDADDPLRSFKKIEIKFFHVHIRLMLTCSNLHENIGLYVRYAKMTKYSNDTIVVGEVLFTEIGICSFTFLCRSYIIVFCPKICTNEYQHNNI